MEATAHPWPKYQCHKKVWALKIAAIEFNEDGSARFVPADDSILCSGKRIGNRGSLATKPGFKQRWHGSEDDLGYFVIYDDGYQSWSPTKAFEEGYTAI